MVWTIYFKEFKSLFKSVKSIITIAILFAVSYLVADLMESVSKIEDLGLDSNGYAMGIFSISCITKNWIAYLVIMCLVMRRIFLILKSF